MAAATGVNYDPFDFEIDSDPYPLWRRLREESPVYYNEKYDFYALSRYEDVERCLTDWRTYSSAKGTILELIKSGMEIPPGSIIFEDPPDHDLHRGLLSRVFTPRKMQAIEPKVREFCAQSLDPLVGAGGFDFIRDLGAQMPMRTIGMLLGIPEQDQEAIRDHIDEGLRLEDGTMPDMTEKYQAQVGQASSLPVQPMSRVAVSLPAPAISMMYIVTSSRVSVRVVPVSSSNSARSRSVMRSSDGCLARQSM